MNKEAHRRLADVLGIDWRGQPVTGFDVRVRADDLPRVTVHYVVRDAERVKARAGLFRLEAAELPKAAPRFDLDRMCAEALQRVQAGIDAAAVRAKLLLKWGDVAPEWLDVTSLADPVDRWVPLSSVSYPEAWAIVEGGR